PVTVGASEDCATAFAGAPPVLVTSIVTENWSPTTAAAGAVMAEVSAAGLTTGATAVEEEAALIARPELASVPAAPAASWSDPVPVPFSVNVHWKVALEPPAMVAGVSVVDVVAFAPPVLTWFGGFGDGSTAFAAAWPLLVTTMVAVKDCPRLRLAGMVKEVTLSAAGCCTVASADETDAEESAAPL